VDTEKITKEKLDRDALMAAHGYDVDYFENTVIQVPLSLNEIVMLVVIMDHDAPTQSNMRATARELRDRLEKIGASKKTPPRGPSTD
jgi:hypothetical protein